MLLDYYISSIDGVGGKLAGTRPGYQLAHAGRLVLSGTCKGLLCLDTSPMCGRCSVGTVSKSLPQKTTAHPPYHCTSFDDCQMALDAAMAINQACFDTGVSIGLDYGQILVIKEQDCYGDTVNVAFKLGEDIAQKNEILITYKIINENKSCRIICRCWRFPSWA